MPRVSEAHLAARRQQILEAARVCFTRNGFHATSMQEVIAEAGLSVGAVYRYFKSKEDLARAIAEQVIGMLSATLTPILDADPPVPVDEALDSVLAALEPQLKPDGAFRFAVQVWAESLRNPALRDLVEEVYGTMHDQFVAVARRARDAGHLPDDADPVAVGSVLFSLVPGYGLQYVWLGTPDRATYLAGLRTLLGGRMAA